MAEKPTSKAASKAAAKPALRAAEPDRVAEAVRRDDRDRYLTDLFAPEAARPHLFALHAFNTDTTGRMTVLTYGGMDRATQRLRPPQEFGEDDTGDDDE